MRQIRQLLIITGAVFASNCTWSADNKFEDVCAKHFNPGFFQNLLETLEPTKSTRELDWCINTGSRSTTIAVDSKYSDEKMDDSKYRESRGGITKSREAQLWINSNFDNHAQPNASGSLFFVTGSQDEKITLKQQLRTLKGFTTIPE